MHGNNLSAFNRLGNVHIQSTQFLEKTPPCYRSGENKEVFSLKNHILKNSCGRLENLIFERFRAFELEKFSVFGSDFRNIPPCSRSRQNKGGFFKGGDFSMN